MLFPTSHAWTPLQRLLIIGAGLVAAALCGTLVYVYESYYRGPGESILIGTWQPETEASLYYRFKPDHTFEGFDPALEVDDTPTSRLSVFESGTWYAGGTYIYL